MKRIVSTLFAMIFAMGSVAPFGVNVNAQATDTIQVIRVVPPQVVPFYPNDPGWALSRVWAEQLNLPLEWAEQDRLAAGGIEAEDVVVCVLDDEVPPNVALDGGRLPQYDANVSPEPVNPLGTGLHGPSVASVVAAPVNDAMGPISTGGYRGHVKVVIIKITYAGPEERLTDPALVKKGLEKALKLKTEGLNVVATVCSYPVGDPDPTGELYKQMEQAGIWNFAAVPTPGASSPFDLDNPTGLFVNRARDHKNVVAVTGLNVDGNTLLPGACWGKQTVSVASPAVNVQVVAWSDPINRTGSFGNTSSAAPAAAGIYALVRSLKEHDPLKAWMRVAVTCSPLNSPDQDRIGYGRLNAYDALTAEVIFPTPQPVPAINSVELLPGGNKRVLVITGVRFPTSVLPTVLVNGNDIGEQLRSSDATTIRLKGKPVKHLKLQPGDNLIEVVDSATQFRSAPFHFFYTP